MPPKRKAKIRAGQRLSGPLGSVTDKRYAYAIMGLATILGTIASSFLPETMNQRLPETLADAAVFGKDQKYWSLYQESNIPFDEADFDQQVSNRQSLFREREREREIAAYTTENEASASLVCLFGPALDLPHLKEQQEM
uniref:Uncharacterized protein n=1 Tax=Timema bartmani TaxID=61472 RepID=A0A7R9F8N6_9NEOP|nr:unnamed protein product [Timema bartmani]